MIRKCLILIICSLAALTLLSGCRMDTASKAEDTKENGAQKEMENTNSTYAYSEYYLERNGISLHLDLMKMEGTEPSRNILLVHGSSNASHEFDINYQDYSFARKMAREGYGVWRIDIAGYGHSDRIEDGLMPDTEYASEDIKTAVDYIVQKTGQDKIDILGWSWGTMTSSRFAAKHPEHLSKLVLYAPVLKGLGVQETKEPFYHNTWEGAAEDFQKNPDGSFDLSVTDPVIIDMFCSSCWRYDGDFSPNGWRKDAFVDPSENLIDLDAITVPTLVVCGDKDPYMNYDAINSSLDHLPEGSKLKIIPGGSHILMYEKNCYKEFQKTVLEFLGE